MLKSFGFTISKESLLNYESKFLNNALIELQTCGFKIVNVWRTELEQYDCPKHFMSVQYTILADDIHNDFVVENVNGIYFGEQMIAPTCHPMYAEMRT